MTQEIQIGDRFRSSNYGLMSVWKLASLADRNRMVSVIALEGESAGTRFGIPEHELGTKFPRVEQ